MNPKVDPKEETKGVEVGASTQGAIALEFVDQHVRLSSDRGRKFVCVSSVFDEGRKAKESERKILEVQGLV